MDRDQGDAYEAAGAGRVPPSARETLSAADVLEALRTLPISTWSYRGDPATRHLGPMAQDFHAVFGFGSDPAVIPAVDAIGVCLAAIQALADEVAALRARVEELGG